MESRIKFRCQNHLEKRSDRRCMCCGKPICTECEIRAESGDSVCSIACQDRLIELTREREEAEKFDPWPVRITSSVFLILLLAVIGTLVGAWLGMRAGIRSERYRAAHERAPQLTVEQFNKRLKWFAGLGGTAGAGCAVWYLVRYYRRRLD